MLKDYPIIKVADKSTKLKSSDKQFVTKCIKHAYVSNQKLFPHLSPNFYVLLFYSRKAFDKERECKTARWEHAFANKKRIAIFAPSVYERLTSHKLREYCPTITHELSHIFYMNLVKTYTPRWLLEGLAMNMDGRKYLWHGKFDTKYLYFSKINYEYIGKFYRSSYLMTKSLIKKKGKIELMRLISLYAKNPVKNNYLRLFNKEINS